MTTPRPLTDKEERKTDPFDGMFGSLEHAQNFIKFESELREVYNQINHRKREADLVPLIYRYLDVIRRHIVTLRTIPLAAPILGNVRETIEAAGEEGMEMGLYWEEIFPGMEPRHKTVQIEREASPKLTLPKPS